MIIQVPPALVIRLPILRACSCFSNWGVEATVRVQRPLPTSFVLGEVSLHKVIIGWRQKTIERCLTIHVTINNAAIVTTLSQVICIISIRTLPPDQKAANHLHRYKVLPLRNLLVNQCHASSGTNLVSSTGLAAYLKSILLMGL